MVYVAQCRVCTHQYDLLMLQRATYLPDFVLICKVDWRQHLTRFVTIRSDLGIGTCFWASGHPALQLHAWNSICLAQFAMACAEG